MYSPTKPYALACHYTSRDQAPRARRHDDRHQPSALDAEVKNTVIVVLHVVEWHSPYSVKTTGEVHARQSAHGDAALRAARGRVAGAGMTRHAEACGVH